MGAKTLSHWFGECRTRRDAISYNSLISSCEGSWRNGLQCFSELVWGALLPDLVAYNSASHSCCPSSWRSSLMLPNYFSYCSWPSIRNLFFFIGGFKLHHAIPHLRILRQLFHTCDLLHDSVSCGTAVVACNLGFSWVGALRILCSMNLQTLRANRWTFSSAVTSCEKSLQPSTALKSSAAFAW